jgi:hypothetical protein
VLEKYSSSVAKVIMALAHGKITKLACILGFNFTTQEQDKPSRAATNIGWAYLCKPIRIYTTAQSARTKLEIIFHVTYRDICMTVNRTSIT